MDTPLLLEERPSSIPGSYHPNAKKLMNFLKSNDACSWNQKSKLKYNDDPIHGSDVVKHLNDGVCSRKVSSSSDAFEKFVSALKSKGYPVQETLRQKTRIPSFKIEKRNTRQCQANQNLFKKIFSDH